MSKYLWRRICFYLGGWFMLFQKFRVLVSFFVFSLLLTWLSCSTPIRPPAKGDPPIINNNKIIQKLTPMVIGTALKIYISHSGTSPFTYKWFKNNALLKNAITDTCTFDTLTLADTGIYYCIVANEWGVDTTIKDTFRLANHAPYIKIDNLLSGDSIYITEMDSLTFVVVASDSDLSDTPVLLSPINSPIGAVFDSITGNFTYVPSFGITDGTAPYVWGDITFIVKDNVNTLGIDSFVIHIVVKDSNSAPVWAVDSVELTINEGDSLFYDIDSVFIGDNEGDLTSFSKTLGVFLGDTSGWYWKPGFSHSGDTVCIISVSDNHVPPAISTLKLKINVADSTPAVILSPLSNVTYKSVTLSWTQSVDPAFGVYKLFYSTTPGVTVGSSLAKIISDIFTTSVTLDSLTENTHYYFKVFTYNNNLIFSGSNEVDTTTTLLTAPVIEITSPEIIRDSGFVRMEAPTIVGSNVTATGIQNMTATINSGPINIAMNGNNWTIDIATVAKKKQWNKFAIHSVDIMGKNSDTTVYVYYLPTLSIPQEPIFTKITNRSLMISWKSIANCTSYILYRSDISATGPFEFVDDISDTTILDTLLHVGTRYWYKIQGYYTVGSGHSISDSTVLSTAADTVTKNWFKEFYQGVDKAKGNKILQTSDGGFIIGGSTYLNYWNENDMYVVRTNKSGDTLWTRTYGGSKADECFDMIAVDGGFVLAGYTKSFTSDSNENVYLVKVDDNGNKVWERNHGWSKNDRAYGIVALNDGTFAITGYGYDPDISGISTDKDQDVMLMQCNAVGDTLWTALWGDTAPQVGYDIQLNNTELVVVGQSGSFIGNQSNVLILRRSSQGNINAMPVNISANNYNDVGYSLIVESDGLIIAGQAEGTMLFGTSKAMLCKLNKLGFVQWIRVFDGKQGAVSRDVKKTLDGGYIVAGVANQHNLMPMNFEYYLVRTNGDGVVDLGFDHVWGSSASEELKSVVVTSDGGYAIAGYSGEKDNKHNVVFMKANSKGKVE